MGLITSTLLILLALNLICRRKNSDVQTIWILPFPLFLFFNRYVLGAVIISFVAVYIGAEMRPPEMKMQQGAVKQASQTPMKRPANQARAPKLKLVAEKQANDDLRNKLY